MKTGVSVDFYPLRFEPIYQQYLWGGRRLGTELNKPIGDGPTFAESWELVDHGGSQSIIRFGPLAGRSLGQLVRESGRDLLGEKTENEINCGSRPGNLRGRFPLLFKFLDANRNLSVQVHPDDRMGARLDPPDLGKTEAWYVMDAKPGALVYAGLREKVSRAELLQAVETNSAESVLHCFEPKAGDCLFIPAGTVHALGEGLLIAEIQQCSNTTFRLYDWGRLDKDGKPRELHVEQGLDATDFGCGPVHPRQPISIDENIESIVACDQFHLQRVKLKADREFSTGGSFRILAVTDGKLSIEGDPSSEPMTRGSTCLIPAGMPSFGVRVNSDTEFLMVSPG